MISDFYYYILLRYIYFDVFTCIRIIVNIIMVSFHKKHMITIIM